MKNRSGAYRAPIYLWMAFASVFAAQIVHAEPPEVILNVGATAVDLSWTTEIDSYYFVQVSETLEAGSWVYHDFAAKGDGSSEATIIGGAPEKRFFRIEFYESSVFPLPAVLTANFDDDFADNKTELDQGTSVFGLTFSDPDSLFDEWEFFFFGDLSQDDAGNDDADFTNNLEESQLGLDPTVDERASAFTYTYDLVGRLVTASNDTVSLTYDLDEEGNILSKN